MFVSLHNAPFTMRVHNACHAVDNEPYVIHHATMYRAGLGSGLTTVKYRGAPGCTLPFQTTHTARLLKATFFVIEGCDWIHGHVPYHTKTCKHWRFVAKTDTAMPSHGVVWLQAHRET